MPKEIKMGKKTIGASGSVFIIAEAGFNHAGNFKAARKMVEVAAEAGADAVTFQYIVENEINVRQPFPRKIDWRESIFRKHEIKELISLAKSNGLFSTVCVIDEKSIDEIVDYGADFFKIVSGDITNIPFLKYCAKKGLPLFISTGAASLGEIEMARDAVKSEGNPEVVLYHTNTNYPTPLKEINLRVISTLQAAFDEIIGFCDHTEGYLAPLIATALGAKVIEKHFTLDRSKKGSDYEVSLEPLELKEMIRHLRNIEIILGSPFKKLLESEKNTVRFARRSIVAKQSISKGARIKRSMLAFKRPGTGFSPANLDFIVGRTVKKDIKPDEIFDRTMI